MNPVKLSRVPQRIAWIPLLVLVSLYLGSGIVAKADTITFNSLEQAGAGQPLVSDPYIEGSYRIQDQGNLFYNQWQHPDYAGSAGLHERISNGLLTLTRTDGGRFTLLSIDLSVLNPSGTSPAVTFVGNLFGGGTVTQSFTPTVFGFRTFVFNSSFTNLTSVTWHQGSEEANAHQFDNIVVNTSVPEPASMVLLGSGLVGLGGAVRRRRIRSKK